MKTLPVNTPSATRATTHRPVASAWRLLACAMGAIVLALIFAAYLRPGFALDLVNRFVLCL